MDYSTYFWQGQLVRLRGMRWEQRYHKCNSACLHTNQASIRLHEKLGFIQEGCRRRVCFMNGRYYDEILFGLTRDEFDLIYVSSEEYGDPS